MKRFLILLMLLAPVLTLPLSAKAEDQAAPQPPAAEEQKPAAPAQPAAAAAPKSSTPNVIISIDVRGNQLVSTNTVLSKIRSRQGQPLVQETVNDDIKRLYSTSYFQDIRMDIEETPEGYRLHVEVIEKPIVKEVIIEGATVFKEDKIRKELKIVEGQILDRKAVKVGVEAVQKLYGNKGFRFVDIQSDVKVNRQSKEATVYIRVQEGLKYKIKDVKFEGNQAFKAKKLLKFMKTRKKGLMFLRSGVFKQENFEKDIERLQLFYQQEGYLDAKIEPSFDYDDQGHWIYVKILIDEGKHYVTGDVQIQGNRLFPQSEIWQELEMLPGLTYSQYYISKDIEKIVNYYKARGYMDARVVPEVKLNRDNGKVDIIYKIEEGDLYFVEKVIVRGNTKTKDVVIRRELRIRPGEKFDGDKIEKSKQRLQNLDYFEDITYDTEPASAPNRKDLVFRVKEKRTGELSFGGGVSSVDRFVGFGEISQRNFDFFNWPRFTGAGQSLSLSARIGSISRNYNIEFVEPYLFGKPIAWTSDLYNTKRFKENTDFDETRTGVGTTFTKRFRDVFRYGTGYILENVKINDFSDDAPDSVTRFSGNNVISKWRALILGYDSRDSVFNPTKGTQIGFNADLVGGFIGGEHDYYILQINAAKYWTLFKKHLLEARIQLGTAKEYAGSDEVPIFDRFYAGGLGSVRGFQYRRVGPKEAGDAIGGQSITLGSVEYTIPIPHLDAFKSSFFIDAANVDPDSYRVGFGDFSISAGPGLKIKTPLGPVAFYYGYPIANRDTKNRNGRFEFSLSRGF